MVNTPCAICGSFNDYKVLYKSNFSQKDLSIDIFSARRLPDGSHYQIVKCKNYNEREQRQNIKRSSFNKKFQSE